MDKHIPFCKTHVSPAKVRACTQPNLMQKTACFSLDDNITVGNWPGHFKICVATAAKQIRHLHKNEGGVSIECACTESTHTKHSMHQSIPLSRQNMSSTFCWLCMYRNILSVALSITYMNAEALR